ncbi:MAG: DUF1232 domain-containing protein [Nitrospirae bacterium]|nr:DUF1232 domain-containing protein [Nitrospirota bacterium]MBF0541625.1 DUF1232 domain-containing protein [Nitrospirota bacterium]
MINIINIINKLRQRISSNPIIKFLVPDPNIKSGKGPVILLIFSIIYLIYPFDLIPDVPFFGWFDDIIFMVVAIINLVEKKVFYKYEYIRKTLNRIKWIIFLVGGSFVLIFVLMTLGALKLIIG